MDLENKVRDFFAFAGVGFVSLIALPLIIVCGPFAVLGYFVVKYMKKLNEYVEDRREGVERVYNN